MADEKRGELLGADGLAGVPGGWGVLGRLGQFGHRWLTGIAEARVAAVAGSRLLLHPP